MNIDERRLEKTKLFAYMIYITYCGTDFDSFDENKACKSVKGYIKEILEKEKIKLVNGLQQAGRTDKNVSATENIIYFMTTEVNVDRLKKYSLIKDVKKVIPYLEFPSLIEKRKYIFEYPKEKIKNSYEKIIKLCQELSGYRDYSKFTTKKGRNILNTFRNIEISYIDGKLYFIGDSFLPHQVRIMSSYILTNSLKELEGKYLKLEKIYLKDFLKDLIFERENLDNPDVIYCEKSKKFTYIYTKDKAKLIGKNGKNIKKLNISNKVIICEVKNV